MLASNAPHSLETQLGPYHPVLPSGLRLSLELRVKGPSLTGWDSEIAEVQVETGRSYIGLEQRVGPDADVVEWDQALRMIEELCAPCSQANTLAYVQAIEAMGGLAPPPRAVYLRLVLAETERIASHLLNAADTLAALGVRDIEAGLRDMHERLLNALANWSGARLQPGLITYGGLSRNIGDSLCRALALETRHIERALRARVNHILGYKEIAERLVGLGVIEGDEAIEAGLRGPTARASGVPADIRADFPTDAYEEESPTIVVQRAGDAFSRLVVRLLECLESLRLIEEALDDLPHGPVRLRGIGELRGGSGVGRVEGPRGEIFCWARGDKHGLTGLHLSAGSFPSMAVLPGLLRGHSLEDLGLLLLSLDLCLPCMER